MSNVCEAGPRSLFWARKGLNEFPEMCSNFPSTWIAIHGAYSYGAQNRGFVAGSQTGLTGGLVLSVAKATSALSLTFYIVEEQRLEKFNEVATLPHKRFYQSF